MNHKSTQIRQVDVIAINEFLWLFFLGIPSGRYRAVYLTEYGGGTFLQECVEGLHRLVEAFV